MRQFPHPRSNIPELDPVVESWRLSATLHEWTRGASDAQIAKAEARLGRRIPSALRAIYEMSNGLGVLQSNLIFDPLIGGGDKLGLVTNSIRLRKWGWPIPEELAVFGGNGGDELFGIWLPVQGEGTPRVPVIEVGEIFEPRSFAVVGTDFPKFLTAWTAFYTISYAEDGSVGVEAVDALRVPARVRSIKDEDRLFSELFRWADPDLPDYHPDPYKRGIDADRLRTLFGDNRRHGPG